MSRRPSRGQWVNGVLRRACIAALDKVDHEENVAHLPPLWPLKMVKEEDIRRRRSTRTTQASQGDATAAPSAAENGAAHANGLPAANGRSKARSRASAPSSDKSRASSPVELIDEFLGESRKLDFDGTMNDELHKLPPLLKPTRNGFEMEMVEEGQQDVALGSAGAQDGSRLLGSEGPATGAVSTEDLGNFVILLLLYCLQGVPLGLTFGSIPFLLKSRLSYHELAVFSFASYPYSLKLLWSPIVDAYFFKSIGRRKSWIIPIQVCIAFLLVFLGTKVDGYLQMESVPVTTITAVFLLLVFFSATQDIAVDGWALTLLSKENVTYASTAQTIGLNSGYFLSFTVFLALNSPEFCNKYLRAEPKDVGYIQLGSYLQFWGVAYLVATFLLAGKREQLAEAVEDVRSVYQTMWKICSLPNMKTLIAVLLLSKIGFITNEVVTGLKLLELGFSREDLALAVLCDFPLEIIFGYYAARWSSGDRPLVPWLTAFYGRLFCAALGMGVIYIFPASGTVGTGYFTLVIASTVLTSFMSTIQFVSIGCFFARISDPSVGGTYMTLLNTLSNLGGTWPKAIVLQLVDYFTITACRHPAQGDAASSCASDALRDACKAGGGTCSVIRDGYYIVNLSGLCLGAALFLSFIKPRVQQLEVLPTKSWRVKEIKH